MLALLAQSISFIEKLCKIHKRIDSTKMLVLHFISFFSLLFSSLTHKYNETGFRLQQAFLLNIIRNKHKMHLLFEPHKSMRMANLRCQPGWLYKQLGTESHIWVCLWASPEIINRGRSACTKCRWHFPLCWELEAMRRDKRKCKLCGPRLSLFFLSTDRVILCSNMPFLLWWHELSKTISQNKPFQFDNIYVR